MIRAGLTALTSLSLFLLILAWPMDTRLYLSSPASALIRDAKGEFLYCNLDKNEEWRFPIPFDKISPRLINATLAAEDQRYFKHHGVDIVAIIRAIIKNLKYGSTTSGASTITMQVVKMAERRASRTSLTGKLRQVTQAIRLELRADKKQILEAYFNNAPYIDNVRGCEAASRRLYGKPTLELSMSEAVLLAGLPKAPSALNPTRHPEKARLRRRYVLDRMLKEKSITIEDYDRVRVSPLGAERHAFPRLAPHLAQSYSEALNKGQTIDSTLDRDIQKRLERLLSEWAAYTKTITNGEVSNAAVIALDVPTVSVLAKAGSAEYFDNPIGGQFDSAKASRPAGSTLKPFLYALAMNRDQLYPEEMLLDARMDIGRYNPRNYEDNYKGIISADIALRKSLNIPALSLLNRIGVSAFYNLLQDLRFDSIDRPASHYGLGLILGNCEVELEELAAAYAMLANRGMYKRARSNKKGTAIARRLLPEDICLHISAMLEQNLPDSGAEIQATRKAPEKACWKTGTSSGRHDAWTVLYNEHYVVAVWVGNNDYTPSERLVGAEIALPLASEVFRLLPAKRARSFAAASPESFRPVTLCAATGLPNNSVCPATRSALLAKSINAQRVCDVHRRPPARWENKKETPTILENWPSGPLGWDLANTPARAIQNAKTPDRSLNIIQPSEGSQFIRMGSPQGDKIRLLSSQDQQRPIHWYHDGHFHGTSRPGHSLFLDLEIGSHELSCMTPSGESAAIEFKVLSPR